ncbi:uncharacterized protein [Prorops nasuta]|uniref:uncharacterized protein n=1 Tax=Prorops nasuta TaxID=863751 RepID=UPI0034CDF046
MIGRADIEGSKSDVAMNAWPPQSLCVLNIEIKPAFALLLYARCTAPVKLSDWQFPRIGSRGIINGDRPKPHTTLTRLALEHRDDQERVHAARAPPNRCQTRVKLNRIFFSY